MPNPAGYVTLSITKDARKKLHALRNLLNFDRDRDDTLTISDAIIEAEQYLRSQRTELSEAEKAILKQREEVRELSWAVRRGDVPPVLQGLIKQ